MAQNVLVNFNNVIENNFVAALFLPLVEYSINGIVGSVVYSSSSRVNLLVKNVCLSEHTASVEFFQLCFRKWNYT